MSEMEWDSFEKTDNQAEEREKKEGQEVKQFSLKMDFSLKKVPFASAAAVIFQRQRERNGALSAGPGPCSVPGGGKLRVGQETGPGLQLGIRKFGASFYSLLGIGQTRGTAFSFLIFFRQFCFSPSSLLMEIHPSKQGFVWEDAAQRASSGLLEKVLSGW